GYIFVDRDGEHFRHILNWLRDGMIPNLKDSDYAELLREAEYYQLLLAEKVDIAFTEHENGFCCQGLIERINTALSKKRDEDDNPELTRRDIIKCIQSEKVKFRGVNLSGLDLSKLDLSDVDFSHASLKGVFFSRANLQCAKFRDVDAEGSIFHNATLRECEFTGANLRGALLADACLMDCSFCGADLRSAHLQSADLTNTNLEGANLEGANLKGAKLTNANLKGANLQRAYLRLVDLRETDLDGAKLDGCKFAWSYSMTQAFCTYCVHLYHLLVTTFQAQKSTSNSDGFKSSFRCIEDV
uniref:Potassium channel tetramerisation-type BTB domain-containing protein n=1 Tax=Chenopodium quinoa TaxID=63459 RepID=A0A803NCW2_CHEQI